MIAFFVMLTWYLCVRLPSVFWLGVIIAALVFTVTAPFERCTPPLWTAMNRQQLSFSRTRGTVRFSHRPLHHRIQQSSYGDLQALSPLEDVRDPNTYST
ncbi:hypothetical protein [Halalkalicoccus salilacus]|uniref:hypothetical protein n=1 Tax=Halalkalicoccus sp. GCM10025704 TaxID=3252662 RepID=UPI003608DAC0